MLSGAGPSILIVSEKNNLDKIKSIVKEVWNDLNVKAELITMPVENQGAIVLTQDE